MKLKIVGRLSALLILVLAAPSAHAQLYRDADHPLEARVDDLLQRMTLREKFWQLFMLAGGLGQGEDLDVARYEHGAFGFQLGHTCDGRDAAVCADAIQRHFVEDTRLGIPVILFEESLHGVVQRGATAFPQAIGLAATFDPDLMAEISQAMAAECRSRGIRQVLSPVVNLAEDVRWGRTEETYGEDPHLAGIMGTAFVGGFEEAGIITTPKHLVANVGAGGRDSYPVHADERYLRELLLPPFRACFAEGGSRSVMTAYNSLSGTPCTAHPWLNRTWLKEELGFAGFVISDAGAVGGANVLHMTAADYAEAAARAWAGGLDVIFQTSFDHAPLFWPAVEQGMVDLALIDAAVARVLRAKFALGLFEEPYVGRRHGLAATDRRARRDLARRAAGESLVLLANPGGALPLRRDLKRVAVLGPDADQVRLGGYSGPGNDLVSVLDGIRGLVGGNTEIVHARGCSRTGEGMVPVPGRYLSCDLGAGLKGEYFDNIELAGAPVAVRLDPQVAFHWTLAAPVPGKLPADFYSVRWTGRLRAPAAGPVQIGLRGTDGYRLYLDGRLVIDNWRKTSAGLRVTELELEDGRQYALRLEYFETVGNAHLELVWDHGASSGGDGDLEEAVQLARASDAAVVVVGLEEGEFRDRARLGLPGRQAELLRLVALTGTPTVAVIVGGSAVTMNDWADLVDAVLMAWYPGEAGGEAVARALFGLDNPAGRLPITFPLEEGQLPLVYNHKPTGRGDDYVDLTGLPRFPFGHGLSYTTFAYENLRFERAVLSPGESTTVSCTVRNTGPVAGDEVVQLYLRDDLASVARPVQQLEGFRRVHLQPGAACEVSFTLGPEQLSLLDAGLRPVVEPGEFRVMIGASSRDIRLRGVLRVVE